MTTLEYLKEAIDNRLYAKLNWYFSVFTVPDYSKSDYIKIEDNTFKVLIKDEWKDLEYTDKSKPIFNVSDLIKINAGYLKNVETELETTIGRLIVNTVLLHEPFGNKIKYVNGEVGIRKLEAIIAPMMRSKEITVDEYLKFTDCVSLLTSLSKIFNVSATEKNTVSAPGMNKEKQRLIKELETKYGKDWSKNPAHVNELKDGLRKYDKEWLKDDPTMGKLLGKKITDNARTMQYMTVGIDGGFAGTDYAVNVANSLEDGYPKDKQGLATMFNASRAASYDRGHETQKGGVAAKDILRSTSSITIKAGDCHSKEGLDILVDENNIQYLVNRYDIKGNLLEDPKKFMGQVITIRSPMYCKYTNNKVCEICGGKVLAGNPKAIGLNLLKLSSFFLTVNMKATHNSQTKNLEYNILEEL